MRNTANPSRAAFTIEPPAIHLLPVLHASGDILEWLEVYWEKLGLNRAERTRLALTQDRREFARWTGRRLNPLALGCYCYLPGTQEAEGGRAEPALARTAAEGLFSLHDLGTGQLPLAGMEMFTAPTPFPLPASRHRHLIFIDPDLLPLGREVTIAHELIHLSDRVRGRPRRHHCHGYDAIAVDEATITGRDPQSLRDLLYEETRRREAVLRASRPIRYLYVCTHCGKEYPRVRRYARPVSCGACDRAYNPLFLLILQAENLHLPTPVTTI